MEKELPARKPTRLSGYDYSNVGAYFITICVQQRKPILSTIVGEGSPLPKLSSYGNIADRFIQKIPEQYPEISVDEYVIMPNHIHLLLWTGKESGRRNASPTVNNAMGWLKYQITKEINSVRNTVGEKVFQRSFYDHIVRNEKDYQEIRKYICENPLCWQCDEFYEKSNEKTR